MFHTVLQNLNNVPVKSNGNKYRDLQCDSY